MNIIKAISMLIFFISLLFVGGAIDAEVVNWGFVGGCITVEILAGAVCVFLGLKERKENEYIC